MTSALDMLKGKREEKPAGNPLEAMALRMLESMGLNKDVLNKVSADIQNTVTHFNSELAEVKAQNAKILALLEAQKGSANDSDSN